jgi:hypothetical protein
VARVTSAEVKAIRPDVPATFDFTPYIAAATLMVDELAASECGSGLSDAILKEVERWLSAHLSAVASPQKKSERFEGYAATFQRGDSDQVGILSTHYGQMANTLSGGCLYQLDGGPATIDFI